MKLHEQVKLQKIIIDQYDNDINMIKRYLKSAKFSININVNKNDILMRISEMERSINAVKSEL